MNSHLNRFICSVVGIMALTGAGYASQGMPLGNNQYQVNGARGSVTYQTFPNSPSNSGSSSNHIIGITGSNGNSLQRSYANNDGIYAFTTTGPGGYSVTKNYDSSGAFINATTTAPVVEDPTTGEYTYQTNLGSVAYSPGSQIASINTSQGRNFDVDYSNKTISGNNRSFYVDPSSGAIYTSNGGVISQNNLWTQDPNSAVFQTSRGLKIQAVTDPTTGNVVGYTGFNDQLNIYSTYDPANHTVTIAGPAMGYSIPNKYNTQPSGVSETFTDVYFSPANKDVTATNQAGQTTTLYFDPSEQMITTSNGGSLRYNPTLNTRDFTTSTGVQGSFSVNETAPSEHTIWLSNGTAYSYNLDTGIFTNQATNQAYTLDLLTHQLVPVTN